MLNSTLSAGGKVRLAYRQPSVDTSKWVAWAINPTSTGMDGAQALVAYQQADGSMRAYTSPISGDQTKLEEGKLSFDVSDLSATYAGSEITVFATITPPAGNGSTVNQVWQEGPLTGAGTPGPHPFSGVNTQSKGTLNFASGLVGSGAGSSRLRRKNVSMYKCLSLITSIWRIDFFYCKCLGACRSMGC